MSVAQSTALELAPVSAMLGCIDEGALHPVRPQHMCITPFLACAPAWSTHAPGQVVRRTHHLGGF